MKSKIKISAAVLAIFLLVVLAFNIVAASTSTLKAENSVGNLSTAKPTNTFVPSTANSVNSANIKTNIEIATLPTADDLESLKASIPQTLEEAEASILPVRTRYLMYTSDGVHIMWGIFGNGLFVGTDNQGKRSWGIYGQGIFAGFYDGKFFWGRYSNGVWKAEYLFGLRYSHGNYVLFPTPVPSTTSTGP